MDGKRSFAARSSRSTGGIAYGWFLCSALVFYVLRMIILHAWVSFEEKLFHIFLKLKKHIVPGMSCLVRVEFDRKALKLNHCHFLTNSWMITLFLKATSQNHDCTPYSVETMELVWTLWSEKFVWTVFSSNFSPKSVPEARWYYETCATFFFSSVCARWWPSAHHGKVCARAALQCQTQKAHPGMLN